VLLHHAVARLEGDAAREFPGECPERLAVAAAHDDQVVAARARGLGVEAEAVDAREVVGEGRRRGFCGLAVDPDCALAV
jgi:hypothetical protein